MKLFSVLVALLAAGSVVWANDLDAKILQELNLARTNPQLYAQVVAQRGTVGASPRVVNEAVRFLQRCRPLAPLGSSPGLAQAASLHVREQSASGSVGHGSNPWKRIDRFGKWIGAVGENIQYGGTNPRSIIVSLIVDNGIGSRMHRTNIFNPAFRVAGIATGPHARFRTMCVMDFAGGFVEGSSTGLAQR